MDRLLDDLRTLSLADVGALPLHREPSDVAASRARSSPVQGPVAAAKGVALARPVTNAWSTSVDPVRYREIVANLVANALRHTPAGGTRGGGCRASRWRRGPDRPRHRARASRRTTSRACSTVTSGTRTRAGPAWGWRSSAASPRHTAERSRPRATACPGAGRRSGATAPARRRCPSVAAGRSGRGAPGQATRRAKSEGPRSTAPDQEHERRKRASGARAVSMTSSASSRVSTLKPGRPHPETRRRYSPRNL